MYVYLANVAPSPLYRPLIPLLLIKSCAIFAADLGAVPELVPNVLRFELAVATAVVVLATRGLAIRKMACTCQQDKLDWRRLIRTSRHCYYDYRL